MGKIKQNQPITSRTEFFYYAFRNILLVGLPLLVVSAFVLSLPHSSATESASTSDQVYITLSTSCTISSELVSPHTIDINGGQHKENIGATKIGTFCNDNNGYNIYAIGYSNNTDGNTDLIGSLGDNYNIHTGVYDSNNPSNSSWSMKLTAGVGTGINPDTGASIATTPPTIVNGYSNYSAVPNIYTLVASRASGTNMNEDINLDITGSYFTTTYDIYASSIQPSGTYIGKVKYIMTHPNTNAPNTINDIDAAFAMAGKEKVYYDENNNGPYFAMQDMTHDICTSVTRNGEATTTQLVDVRDNKSYYVTKLKDGHCWMTQNLDFDLVTYTNNQGQEVIKPLTSNDTDLTDHSLTSAYVDGYTYNESTGITTWVPASTAKTIDFKGGIVTGWQDSNIEPYSASKIDNTNVGHSSLGNFYNWSAAIASNNSSVLTSNTLSNISQNPKNSICPKGWRLPNITNTTTRVGENDFTNLGYYYGYTSQSFMDPPLYYILSGLVNTGGSFPFGGEYGDWWSSTVNNISTAYRFSIPSVALNDSRSRNRGNSVRCIAR